MEKRQSLVTMYSQENGNIYKVDTRKVLDPVHGFISFPLLVWKFIDTPEFQRLRDIKQLGATFYVFPGAMHSRYQHSLGTAFLCSQYIRLLIENNPEFYKKEQIKQAQLTVTLAGLFHDLGHGPFSHMFDNILIKELWDKTKHGGKQWTHEQASLILIDHLIKNNNLNQSNQIDVDRIKRMIMGNPLPDEKRIWQFELVNNKLTGLDVDKFDYFKRDSFYLGAKNTIVEYQLLMKETKIIKNAEGYPFLCYPLKYSEKIFEIYFSRYRLYKNFYLNRIAQGIQMMLCDILKIANENGYNLLRICENIREQPQNYINLTDSIIKQIERSNSPQLLKARQIIYRLRKRDIYKFVIQTNFFTSSQSNQGQSHKLKIIPEEGTPNPQIAIQANISPQKKKQTKITIFTIDTKEIKKRIIANSKSLQQDDIVVVKGVINYGFKDKNPLDLVKFYKKNTSKPQICESKKQQLSLLSTPRYSQTYIRLYTKVSTLEKFNAGKDSSLEKFNDATQSFTKLCSELNAGVGFQGTTPRKQTVISDTSNFFFQNEKNFQGPSKGGTSFL